MNTDIKSHYHDLLQEIESVDPKMFSVKGDIQNGETQIGIVTDDDIRRIYVLAMLTAREMMHVKADLDCEEDNRSLTDHYRSLEEKVNLLSHMFWHAIHLKYNIWGDAIGIRKNWVLVKYRSPQQLLRGLLESLQE